MEKIINIVAKEKYHLTFKAYEVEGNGKYIVIDKADGEDFAYIDCGYIKGYNFDKVVKEYFESYYGKNLTSFEMVVEE